MDGFAHCSIIQEWMDELTAASSAFRTPLEIPGGIWLQDAACTSRQGLPYLHNAPWADTQAKLCSKPEEQTSMKNTQIHTQKYSFRESIIG